MNDRTEIDLAQRAVRLARSDIAIYQGTSEPAIKKRFDALRLAEQNLRNLINQKGN